MLQAAIQQLRAAQAQAAPAAAEAAGSPASPGAALQQQAAALQLDAAQRDSAAAQPRAAAQRSPWEGLTLQQAAQPGPTAEPSTQAAKVKLEQKGDGSGGGGGSGHRSSAAASSEHKSPFRVSVQRRSSSVMPCASDTSMTGHGFGVHWLGWIGGELTYMSVLLMR